MKTLMLDLFLILVDIVRMIALAVMYTAACSIYLVFCLLSAIIAFLDRRKLDK